jgi:hypothetical protein
VPGDWPDQAAAIARYKKVNTPDSVDLLNAFPLTMQQIR